MSSRIHGVLVPSKESSCQLWKHFYTTLKERFGKDKAREIWLYTFGQQGNTSCTKDSDFNAWAKNHQIAVADGLDKAVAGATKIGHHLLDGAGSLTSIVPKLGIALLIGGVGAVLLLLFRFSKETEVKDLPNLIPAGKALKAAKHLT